MSAPEVSRLEQLRTLRTANVDGAFASAFVTLVSGAFIVKYAKELGASDLWIGVFTGLPSLIGLLQIPGAIWGRANVSFKRYVSPGGLLWRVFHIPFIFIPFLPISTDGKLALMLVCNALAAISIQLVGPIYNDWLAEMVPANARGWFFARRNMIAAVASALAALGGGVLTDYFERQGRPDLSFSVTCAVGILMAGISMVFYYRMTDIPRPNPLQMSVATGVRAMKAPFVDPGFRKVLSFFLFYIIAQSFAGNLFSAYAFESIEMQMTVLQITAVCHAAGNVLFAKFWGYLADKYGNKPLLSILTVGIALTPLQWVFLRPGQDLWNIAILGPGHIFTGMCWSGIAICQYNLLLATAKDEDRANYIGAGLALQAVMGAIGPMLGAVAMTQLRANMPVAQAYHIIFFLTMGLRAASLLLLAPVQEPGSTSLRGALRGITRISPKGFRALKQMTSTADAQVREEAIASAGASGLELARDEVIRALHDPTPRVRRQAAETLARLGGPDAVDALLHMTRDHPDLVDEEILEALGELGDPRAVPHLRSVLESPRPSLRRAAARSLSQIGGADAVQALILGAANREDPDLRRAALQGLRRLGATEAEAVVVDAVLDPLPSVRVAAAEAVAELGIASAAPRLRRALEQFSDEACSEIAYALGATGDAADLRLILQEGRRSTSIITRRRCLLGAARLVGVEADLYRLFLYEDLSRDAQILQLLGPAMKANPVLHETMELFGTNHEQEALERLAEQEPRLRPFAENLVREAFLIAALVFAANLERET